MRAPANKVHRPENKARRFTWRCVRCSRILMTLEAEPRGLLETKCRCGAWNRMRGESGERGTAP